MAFLVGTLLVAASDEVRASDAADESSTNAASARFVGDVREGDDVPDVETGVVRPSVRGLALRDEPFASAPDENGDPMEDRLRLLGTLGRAGVSMLFQEDAETGTLARKPAVDGVRSLQISTEHIARQPSAAVARSTIEWDEQTGEYGFKRIELGFFGRRLWIARDLADTDDRMLGAVFLKFEW